MLQSMYSGISGMKASNQELNVISNNIANSQTTAFKSSGITFEDMYYQSVQGSSAPTTSSGGTNSSAFGTGVKVQGINKDMSYGGAASTSNPLDLSINGSSGFFIVAKGDIVKASATATIPVDNPTTGTASHTITSEPSSTQLLYTQDGSFSKDPDGSITLNGYRLMGYAVSGTDNTGTTTTASSLDPTATTTSTTGTVSSRVDFVDGQKTVTANDGALITLQIPETVHEVATATTPAKDVAVSSWSVDSNGVVTVTLADNKVAAIGQVALAKFTNDSGLDQVGNNMFSESSNSGKAILDSGVNTLGDNNSGSFSTIKGSSLEQSNVDLATEFSHMIEASRAFEANGKIISTGDTILQTIINLKQ
ncbi:flagellar hook-basal body complex protein [Clostridium akagii]|uniref:flagellar hook-basal body complex protein n=1 Tax=Clostridium akagii TaxID=91623 RepID=UPI00047B2BE5|nr:flagellar hook-basal body complex protein [Clostridium akagii]